MRKLSLLTICCISIFATFNSGAVQSYKTDKPIENIVKDLDEFVKKSRKDWRCPGISVGIIDNGKIFFVNDGIGKEGSEQKISEDSIFCIMSSSKIITVSVLHQLADEGLIGLDDPVVKYLPWFKLSDENATKKATVRHLVSHCIGLPKFSADTFWHLGFSQKEIIEKLSKIKVVSEPGEKYAYQNMFVGIAGLLIESVLKKPLKEVVKERIFDKLCMDHSSMGKHPSGFWQKILQFFKKNPAHDSNLITSGHMVLDNKIFPMQVSNEPYIFEGTSGINSTTSDFIKFLECLINKGSFRNGELSGKIFSDKAWNDISTKQIGISDIKNQSSHFPVLRMENGSFYYGNGLFGLNYGEGDKYIKLLMHEGAGSGWRSFWAIAPEYNLGIVIFTNYGSINSNLLPEAVAYQFLDMYFNFSKVDWNSWYYKSLDRYRKYMKDRFDSFILSPPLSLKKLVGKYENDLYGKIIITENDNLLSFSYNDKNIQLKHVGGSVFSFKSNELTARYGDDDSGNIYFQTDQSNNITGLRVSLLREGGELFDKK